jgi:hypothetical protein
MEGAAGVAGNGARRILNADEVGGAGGNGPPYDGGRRVKLAQAVISRTTDGRWKIFAQSDNQVETMLIGDLETIIAELREYSRSDWEQRS